MADFYNILRQNLYGYLVNASKNIECAAISLRKRLQNVLELD